MLHELGNRVPPITNTLLELGSNESDSFCLVQLQSPSKTLLRKEACLDRSSLIAGVKRRIYACILGATGALPLPSARSSFWVCSRACVQRGRSLGARQKDSSETKLVDLVLEGEAHALLQPRQVHSEIRYGSGGG